MTRVVVALAAVLWVLVEVGLLLHHSTASTAAVYAP